MGKECSESVRALVDTGCSQTIVSKRFVGSAKVHPAGGKVVAVDGSAHRCGVVRLLLWINGRSCEVSCLVMEKQLREFDVILGMDVVRLFGGLVVKEDAVVQLGLSAQQQVGSGVRSLGDDLELHPALGGWPKNDVRPLGDGLKLHPALGDGLKLPKRWKDSNKRAVSVRCWNWTT